MTDDNTISSAFFNEVAQIAHFATTYAIAFTFATKWGWLGFSVTTAGIVLYAAWHEFIYDPEHENPATRGSDLEDFVFLCLGPVFAALVHWL